MTSLIPRKYKIIGITDPSGNPYAVDLVHGNPYATVSSYTQNNVPFQVWNVETAGGDNKFYLQNDYSCDTYAGAYHIAEGVPLAGSPKNVGFTTWLIESVPGANGVYFIKTEDGAYAWFVPGFGDYVTIALAPFDQVASLQGARWTFQTRDSAQA